MEMLHEAKKSGLKALLKQMYQMMAEGHGDEAQSLHDKVSGAEKEAHGEMEGSPQEEAGESPAEAASEGDAGPMSFKDKVRTEMRKGSRLPVGKASVMITSIKGKAPAFGKKKYG